MYVDSLRVQAAINMSRDMTQAIKREINDGDKWFAALAKREDLIAGMSDNELKMFANLRPWYRKYDS